MNLGKMTTLLTTCVILVGKAREHSQLLDVSVGSSSSGARFMLCLCSKPSAGLEGAHATPSVRCFSRNEVSLVAFTFRKGWAKV